MFNVTEIRVYKSNNSGGVNIGYGNIVIDDSLLVKFSIMKSSSGEVFVSWPNVRLPSNERKTQVEWKNKDHKSVVENAVLEEFYKVVGVPTTKKPILTLGKKDNHESNDGYFNSYGGGNDYEPEPPPKRSPIIQWKRVE